MQNYAVIALLMGLMGWFALADFGIGASVQNYISETRANNEPYDHFISGSGVLALLLLFASVIALYLVSPVAGPLFLKNFHFISDSEKTKLFFLSGALSVGVGVGGIAYRIWYGEQRGYFSNALPAAAAVGGVFGLLLVRQMATEGRLLLSVMAFMAPAAILPVVALAFQQIRLGFNWAGSMRPRSAILRIMKRGFRFWIFAILAAGVLQVDYIVMSQCLNARDIAAYNLATKVFGFISFIYGAVLLALWPVAAESIAKRQWNVVLGYVKRYVAVGLAFMFVCTFLLIWLMPTAIRMLAPNEGISVPLGIILLLGVYQMIRVWSDTFTMVLQSMSDLRTFWVLLPIQAVASISFQWMLAPIFGIYGIVLGVTASFVLTVAWAVPLAVWKRYQSKQQVFP